MTKQKTATNKPTKEAPPKRKADALVNGNNPHFNRFALRFLTSAKEGGLFSDLDKAMELYSDLIEIVHFYHDRPLEGDAFMEEYLAKAGMDDAQRQKLYAGALTYLKGSEFDVDVSASIELMKPRAKEPDAPVWAEDARKGLRDLVSRELAELPETMAKLDPKDRVAMLCKLLPYTMPKQPDVEGKPEGWPW